MTMDVSKRIKHVILVLSGKGGVGKSTVAAQLAHGLVAEGFKVGLLDIDLCGPSIPKILGLEGQSIHQSSEGWIPVYADAGKRLAVMSIGFLLANRDDPVIWRGPKKNAMIKQFLTDVCWEQLDYLVIDTPPGTSDEHISMVEALKQGFELDGAVLVTTPQAVAVADVRREITFCRKGAIPILGLIENMSGYTCPHCQDCTNVFSTGGGESLAEYAKVPFLGRLPIDPQLTMCMEQGEDFMAKYPASETVRLLEEIIKKLTIST